MLSRVSGVGAFYVTVQDPYNPSNLPNHSNYTWTAAPDTSELVISHTEYVPWSCLLLLEHGAGRPSFGEGWSTSEKYSLVPDGHDSDF